jgi:hypothetical protein
MNEEDEAFEELSRKQSYWGLQGSRKHQIMRYAENVEKKENMNKPITSKKFASDLWGVIQMAIDEAVLAEREACAKLCESLPMQQEIDVRDQAATAIRARGQA